MLKVGHKVGHAAIAALLVLLSACSRPIDQNALDRHRNLGKAFYENPTTKEEAVGEFRQALAIVPGSAREKLNYALALLKSEGHEQEAVKLLEEVQRQDPALPHTWFTLGIYYKRRGDANKAIAQFEGMLARTPNEPIPHYQLGTLYRQLNRTADAQKQFETAAALDPQLAAARFQLYNLYRLAGNTEQAKTYLAEFQRLQALQKTWVIPEDVEWCDYAEIYDPRPASATIATATAESELIDSTGSGQIDLLTWSPEGIKLLLQGNQPAPAMGLERITGVIDVALGDFDNDGLMDLCVLTAAGPELYRNTGGKL